MYYVKTNWLNQRINQTAEKEEEKEKWLCFGRMFRRPRAIKNILFQF